MSDLIDRQTAIDVAFDIFPDDEYFLEQFVKSIEALPSAQPEIIRCKDCRHNHNCDIQYHAQAGDMFFCAGAERRTE